MRTSRLINLIRVIYSRLPLPGLDDPVLILGCGRSGTTILGQALAQHSEVTFLDEPRELWFRAYPATDIWTSRAEERGGKLTLENKDLYPSSSRQLRRLFWLEKFLAGGSVLLEKLPINNFRLDFIQGIFPQARFIHIQRSGLDVARSIETLNRTGNWYGADSYKWYRLADYAKNRQDTSQLPDLCQTDFEKGLLEWRLSTEAAAGFLKHLPSGQYLEISYEDLIEEPVEILGSVLEFLGLSSNQAVIEFAQTQIRRRNPATGQDGLDPLVQQIGGRLLPLSLGGKTKLIQHLRSEGV